MLEKYKTEKPTSPDGHHISKSVRGAIDMILSGLKKIRSKTELRRHMIACTRHAISGARFIFLKLAQDTENMADCQDCVEDKEMNFNDRLVVMALVQYLKIGLLAVDIHDKDINESFNTFFTKNRENLVSKVNTFS